MSGFVYALKCAHDTFYIGKTKDIVTRFENHKSAGQRASQWTRLHPAESIVELLHDEHDDFRELCLSLKYFQLYGCERVRGGPFAGSALRASDSVIIDMLSRELPFEEPRVVAVLACTEGRYFVDSWPLTDLPARFASHSSGKSECAFTRRFPATSIVELRMDGHHKFEHLRLTLKTMFRHGMHNVRGSLFCTGDIQLSNSEVKLVSRLIRCNMFPTPWNPPSSASPVSRDVSVADDEDDEEEEEDEDDVTTVAEDLTA